MEDLRNYDLFFSKYKPKNIIYPNAVARYFDLTLKEAYELCQSRVGKDLRPLYMVKCPVCSHTLSGRYYSIVSIDNELEYGCENCDASFVLNENDIVVYFEKK